MKINMEKIDASQYTVERIFLGKISAEELIIRIIQLHLNKDANGGN